MDTNIIINGVVIQSEWVEAIEKEMREGDFSISTLIESAMNAGMDVAKPWEVVQACVDVWLKLGKIKTIEHEHWRLATPAETEAHNRKMKGGVAE